MKNSVPIITFPIARCQASMFATLAALSLSALEAQGQTDAPLFEADERLEMTLSMDVRELVRNATRRPEVEAVLEYVGLDGAPMALDAEVRTRGKSRLEVCDFPPLSINLRRSQVEGTLFNGQNRIKLVTLCKRSNAFEQALYLERLAYDIYGLVSDHAYRTRLASVTYVDTARKNRATVAPGFFIEHVEGLAERTGLTEGVFMEGVKREDLDPVEASNLAVFQYLISNTDWSSIAATAGEECCHNSDLLIPANASTPVIPVPYDFDQAGLVDTDYALPNPSFRLRSVRQRLYRGFCRHNEEVGRAMERFLAARGAIDELIATSPLDEGSKEDASEYLNEGLDVFADPEERAEEIFDNCRPDLVADDDEE
jgi:hypothetical protein